MEGPILADGWEVAPAEAEWASGFGPKRKAEFLTGRSYARRALGLLGTDSPPIGAHPDRSPMWPEGIAGCITHTRDYCAVAVARKSLFRGIGLDIESVGRITDSIASKVFTDSEREALQAGPDSTRNARISAIFSAKEAFYKMQFPLTHIWVGFQDVSVRLEAEGRFTLELAKDIGEFSQGRVLAGRFLVAGDRVAALMVV